MARSSPEAAVISGDCPQAPLNPQDEYARQDSLPQSVIQAIGNTPLVELSRLTRGLEGRILAKLDISPRLSTKDRMLCKLSRGRGRGKAFTRTDRGRIDQRQHGYGSIYRLRGERLPVCGGDVQGQLNRTLPDDESLRCRSGAR